jgi:hypothetical protein
MTVQSQPREKVRPHLNKQSGYKTELLYDSAIPLLGKYSKELKGLEEILVRQAKLGKVWDSQTVLHLRLTMFWLSLPGQEPPVPLPTHSLLDGSHLVLPLPLVIVGFKRTRRAETRSLSL